MSDVFARLADRAAGRAPIVAQRRSVPFEHSVPVVSDALAAAGDATRVARASAQADRRAPEVEGAARTTLRGGNVPSTHDAAGSTSAAGLQAGTRDEDLGDPRARALEDARNDGELAALGVVAATAGVQAAHRAGDLRSAEVLAALGARGSGDAAAISKRWEAGVDREPLAKAEDAARAAARPSAAAAAASAHVASAATPDPSPRNGAGRGPASTVSTAARSAGPAAAPLTPEQLLQEHIAPALARLAVISERERERLVAAPAGRPPRPDRDDRIAVSVDPVDVPAGREVHVHIDRVEVMRPAATGAAASVHSAPVRPPAPDHAAYLARQQERWGR